MIKIQSDSIFQVPLYNFQNDFTFIVNGNEYQTNKFIATLLSPNVSKIQSIDPTNTTYSITTKTKGNFQQVLDLLSFKEEEFSDDEINFILEIFQALGTEKFDFKSRKSNIDDNNIIKMIQFHEKLPLFLSKQFSIEIDHLSSHFYEFLKSREEELLALSTNTLEKVINNENLKLNNEDELLQFIIKLFEKDKQNGFLFEYVHFTNVEITTIKEFLQAFDIEYLTNGTWISITNRLIHEKTDLNENSRYQKAVFSYPKEIKGIFKYLIDNSNIDEEVKVTCSSNNGYDERQIVDFDNKSEFYTKNQPNSWICFELKKHQIVPTGYTIKSHDCNKGGCQPKNWIIQGSNDQDQWIKLDEQKNCSYLNGKYLHHSFTIENNNEIKEFKFIRIIQTGVNWFNNNQLALSSIEFNGHLI